MDAIILRSPFNGDTIQVSPDQCNPAMLQAMVQAGFVHLNAPKTNKKAKGVGAEESALPDSAVLR